MLYHRKIMYIENEALCESNYGYKLYVNRGLIFTFTFICNEKLYILTQYQYQL